MDADGIPAYEKLDTTRDLIDRQIQERIAADIKWADFPPQIKNAIVARRREERNRVAARHRTTGAENYLKTIAAVAAAAAEILAEPGRPPGGCAARRTPPPSASCGRVLPVSAHSGKLPPDPAAGSHRHRCRRAERLLCPTADPTHRRARCYRLRTIGAGFREKRVRARKTLTQAAAAATIRISSLIMAPKAKEPLPTNNRNPCPTGTAYRGSSGPVPHGQPELLRPSHRRAGRNPARSFAAAPADRLKPAGRKPRPFPQATPAANDRHSKSPPKEIPP